MSRVASASTARATAGESGAPSEKSAPSIA